MCLERIDRVIQNLRLCALEITQAVNGLEDGACVWHLVHSVRGAVGTILLIS